MGQVKNMKFINREKISLLPSSKKLYSFGMVILIFLNLVYPAYSEGNSHQGITLEAYYAVQQITPLDSYILEVNNSKDNVAKKDGHYYTVAYSSRIKKALFYDHGVFIGAVKVSLSELHDLIDSLQKDYIDGKSEFFKIIHSTLSKKRIIRSYQRNYSQIKKEERPATIIPIRKLKISMGDIRINYNANKYDGTNATFTIKDYLTCKT